MKNNKNNSYDMKNLNVYLQENTCINEKLVITHYKPYSCAPETKEELRNIIEDRLMDDPNVDLNDIDVSNIKDMSELFFRLDPHNIDVSKWDVSNVKDMHAMFWYCESFKSDLSYWDVSNVTNISYMFDGCYNFNSDLSNWDVSKVEDMRYMFDDCDSLKKLPKWYVK